MCLRSPPRRESIATWRLMRRWVNDFWVVIEKTNTGGHRWLSGTLISLQPFKASALVVKSVWWQYLWVRALNLYWSQTANKRWTRWVLVSCNFHNIMTWYISFLLTPVDVIYRLHAYSNMSASPLHNFLVRAAVCQVDLSGNPKQKY